MKVGLVLEGGALRGMFTAGVLDCFLENDILFPYVIGVSAGGGTAMNYASRQIGRSREVINPPKKERYYGPGEVRRSGRILNLDRMFYDFVYEKYPFDFERYFSGETQCEYVVTDCETGKAAYMTEQSDRERLLKIGKASCSLPGICNPVDIDGVEYLDGSLTDSLPVQRALDAGCDKVLVVLTKQEGTLPTDYRKYKWLIRKMFGKKYPDLVQSLMNRSTEYERQAALLQELQDEGVAYVIRPKEMSVGHFEGDPEKLEAFYLEGYTLAQEHKEALLRFMTCDASQTLSDAMEA